MLMSIVEELRASAAYPELQQSRVFISGLTSTCGVDVARAFAERGTRLVVRAAETSSEIDTVLTLLAQSSAEMRVFATDDIEDSEAAVTFAKGPAQQAFGGLETIVNLIEVHPADLKGRQTQSDIEDLVSEKLLAPTLAARILANRMQLTLTEGSILHVVRAPQAETAEAMLLIDILRATLAAMVRSEAANWSPKGTRINAVAPAGPLAPDSEILRGEPDIAALALFLASEKGERLAGHVFDAALTRRRC